MNLRNMGNVPATKLNLSRNNFTFIQRFARLLCAPIRLFSFYIFNNAVDCFCYYYCSLCVCRSSDCFHAIYMKLCVEIININNDRV